MYFVVESKCDSWMLPLPHSLQWVSGVDHEALDEGAPRSGLTPLLAVLAGSLQHLTEKVFSNQHTLEWRQDILIQKKGNFGTGRFYYGKYFQSKKTV